MLPREFLNRDVKDIISDIRAGRLPELGNKGMVIAWLLVCETVSKPHSDSPRKELVDVLLELFGSYEGVEIEASHNEAM